MLRGFTKKIKEPSRLLGTWYLAVFQKKLGTKLFIFRVKKNIFISARIFVAIWHMATW
jgi:hypothetical protein